MPRAVLAIDQGTTGTTALVIGHDCSVLGRAYSEFTQYYPKPGWVEHDADEIWRVSLEVAEERRGRRRHRRRRARRHRHHQPARDHRHLGSPHRPPGPPRRRLAEPADRRDLRSPPRTPVTRSGSTSAPGSSSTPTSRRRRSAGSSTGCPTARRSPRPAICSSAPSTAGCCGNSPAARSTPPTRPTPRALCSTTSTAAAGRPICSNSSTCLG